jgi:putative ABC transport system permease protein
MIAIALVCGIFIITEQLKFMQKKNLGYDPSAKIVLPIRTSNAHDQYDALKKEIENLSGVKAVSGAYFMPGSRIFSDMFYFPDGGSMEKTVGIHRNQVDLGYMDLLNMKLIAGRGFSDNRESESRTNVIINRMVANKFGIQPEKIVGQGIHFDWEGKRYDFQVIGVMEDYHQNSLHEEIRPTLFQLIDSTKFCDNMLIAASSENFSETIKSVEKIWRAQVSDTPFEYSFLDDNIQKLYKEDRRTSKIITTFALIAMIICSLGLYGLSSYMAERRFKEIGIRKVMGASVRQIVAMMSAEFVKLVLIAFVFAVPIAWYGMGKWLQGFAYRIEINWLVFGLAGIIALAIALVTVSFESIKSAMGDPVKSLRSE